MKILWVALLALLISSCSRFIAGPQDKGTNTPLADAILTNIELADSAALSCGRDSLPKCLEVHVMNVKQGSSAVAILPDGTSLLFDAGGSDYNAKALFISKLNDLLPDDDYVDILVLSHSDNDHTNMLNISEKLNASKLKAIHLSGTPDNYARKIAAKEFMEKLYSGEIPKSIAGCDSNKKVEAKIYCYPSKYTPNSPIQEGMPYSREKGLYSYILVANADAEAGTTPTSSNANSLISAISYGSTKILFMGDGEGVTTAQVMNESPQYMRSNTSVYVMAHHGSSTKNSNNIAWLQDIEPRSLIASSGIHKRWRHPDEGLITTIIHTLGSTILNTGQHNIYLAKGTDRCQKKINKAIYTTVTNGTILFKSDGNRFIIKPEYSELIGLHNC